MSPCSQCGTSVSIGAQFCPNCGSRVSPDPSNAQTERLRRPSAETVAQGERKLMEALRQATLGEYEVLGEVGRGGMAVVYLAHDIALDRKVAIKVMSPALTLMDPGIQERFKREARTAASLSHPHIIPVYTVRESEEIAYFVMKYVVGRSLESVLQEVGALPIAVVQTVLHHAGGALGHAHRRGVVHRDVKPGNIILDEDGWVVVTDFGIAKVAEAEALTMTGGVVGTPMYMSPEQCSGKPVAGASDQYSLGVVAYEMISGLQPFRSETMVNLIYDHCHTAPVPLQQVKPDCPPQIAAAVMRMLEKDPANRWPTVEEAVEAIGLVSDSQGGTVRTQMLTLAQGSPAHSLLEKFRTPASSVRSAPSTPVTPTPPASEGSAGLTTPPSKRRRAPAVALWAAPFVAAAAIGTWLVLGNGADGGSAAAPPGDGPPEAPQEAVATALPITAVDVTPPHLALVAGETTTLIAAARDQSGVAVGGAAVTWTAGNPAVAAVSPTGEVTALAPGTGTITARAGASSATVALTVTAPRPRPAAPSRTPPAVGSVAVAPASATTVIGRAVQLQAVVYDQRGVSLTGRSVSWSSSDPNVARVSAAGTVTGVSQGMATISASTAGHSGSASVSVGPTPVASLGVAPERAALEVGATLQLSATPRDDRGAPVTGRAVAWRSDNPEVATVSRTGQVMGVAPGSATITAAGGGASASATIVVEAPAAAPAPDPRSAIQDVVESYRRAIESRDLSELRRAYPGMTPEQEDAWREFFANVDDLTAELRIVDLEISGDDARGRMEATYQYRMNRNQTRTFEFRATFRRGPQGWTLTEVE